jgi:hypothetical protein
MRYVTLQQQRPKDGKGYLVITRSRLYCWGRYNAKCDAFIDKDAKLSIAARNVDGFWA